MIWPFKRKPSVVDARKATDICVGDKVECIRDDWDGPPETFDPQVGDILTVTKAYDAVNGLRYRRIWLEFKATPKGCGYASCSFRKLVEIDDKAMIARLKSLPARNRERV